MKKMMVTLLMLGAFTACNNNEPTPEKPKEVTLDPNAMVLVNGKESKAEAETCEYIVKNATFMNRDLLMEDGSIKQGSRLGGSLGIFEDDYMTNRDFEGCKFKFFGNDIIDEFGKPAIFFKWVNMIFTVAVHNGKRLHPLEVSMIPTEEITIDTVAYIPNSVARKCKENIMKALEEGDLEECYRIFEEDYNFIPITGPELQKLRDAGLDEI